MRISAQLSHQAQSPDFGESRISLSTATAVAFAVLARGHIHRALEEDTEVFGVADADAIGDRLERQIGIAQQLTGALHLRADDLLVRRAADQRRETLFERS